jgi:hypothetical protein
VDILRNIKGGSCKSGTLAIAGHPERLKTNKHFFLYFSVLATASSVYTGNVENYGPQYAIDGQVSDGRDGDTKVYQSANEVQPWFQMEFVEATVVKGVTFTNRYVSRLRDLQLKVA